MSTITLEAETRTVRGKGASRRLRRLENKIPAIIYGGDEAPHAVNLLHNKVTKALENEALYSSVFSLQTDGKAEHVILKDIQRHPYKPIILHMDFQRVSDKDILVKLIPLHFMNEDKAPGVKAGGMVHHLMSQVEVRCQAQKLPEFINVDLATLGLNEALHLSDLKLPKGVELTAHVSDSAHNTSVVAIHTPRGGVVENETPATE